MNDITDFTDYNGEYDFSTEEEYPRDNKVDEAKENLVRFIKKQETGVFHIRQLELMFEKTHFHWITAKAIGELEEEGFLSSKTEPLVEGSKVKFVFHYSNRYYRREIVKKKALIMRYSQSGFSRAMGDMAEILFLNALALRQFVPFGKKIREFGGMKWTKTGHDLDFGIQKDGIAYGCEVKNRLPYIEKNELGIKLEMCKFLKLTPLFIMRFAPKNYIYMINRDYGGYSMLFETQIYPPGYEDFAKEVTEKLKLPVVCSRAIPGGIIDRFINNFHAKLVNSKKNHSG